MTSSPMKKAASASQQRNYGRRFSSFYARSFEQRPLLTVAVANCVLGGIGDAAAQAIPMLTGTTSIMSWDWARSARFFSYGLMLGPVAGKWNEFLEKSLPLRSIPKITLTQRMDKIKVESPLSEKIKAPASPLSRPVPVPSTLPLTPGSMALGRVSLLALVKRVLADQLFMAPLGIFVFVTAMAMMEGLDLDAWLERLQRLYIPILLMNWKIWPWLQLISFRFIPLSLRVPFTASCGVLWTIFLSARQAAVAQESKLAAA